MKESKNPASPYLTAATSLMDASTPPSSSHPPRSPSSVSSSLSSHSSSSLSKFSSSSISPPSKSLHYDGNVCPAKPSFSLLRKRKGSTCKWVSRLFRLHNLTMEVDEGVDLLHRHSQGVDGSWCDVDEHKVNEKPKRELRFAAKIAAAMDADGFLGVKDSVCADNTPIGLQESECVKKLSTLCDGPIPVLLPRAPMEQARPRRRRWKFFRRFRRTRVSFARLLQKVRNVFTTSTRRTLQVSDGFAK